MGENVSHVGGGKASRGPEILLPKFKDGDNGQPLLLSQEMEDSGEWLSQGEWAPDFEPALFVILNTQVDVTFDPTLTAEQARGRDIGYLEAEWGRWSVGLNYTRTWNQLLPPWHMGVRWRGEIVGILSPLFEVRTCWKCRLHGWQDLPADYRLRTGDPRTRVPRVRPGRPCPGYPEVIGGVATGRVVKCGQLDWWGHFPQHGGVTRLQFQHDAAERIARVTDESALFDEMTTTYDEAGEARRIVLPN